MGIDVGIVEAELLGGQKGVVRKAKRAGGWDSAQLSSGLSSTTF